MTTVLILTATQKNSQGTPSSVGSPFNMEAAQGLYHTDLYITCFTGLGTLKAFYPEGGTKDKIIGFQILQFHKLVKFEKNNLGTLPK